MMAQFMRNHIGLSEIGIVAAKFCQLVPETEIDVDALVLRAVEGSCGGLRIAAA